MVDYKRSLTQRPPKTQPAYIEPKGKLKGRKLKAIGLTSGVGSMLIGADIAGFDVIGNIEWRNYYRLKDHNEQNTFIENFPGAFLARGLADVPEGMLPYDIDLAMGHPECGLYSVLNSPNKNSKLDKLDAGDIPLFLEYVSKIKPRYFVMDDLPQCFNALPMESYIDLLPEYDLFPEWISNYHYGNIQKHRKRMFMIGSLKSENYVFEPGELEEFPEWTIRSKIEDIEGKWGCLPNHEKHTTNNNRPGRFLHMRYRGDRPTWKEVQKFFKENQKPRENFQYYGKDGDMKVRPSLPKMDYDWTSNVLTGGNPTMHPTICLPISIRERARIQGFPDNFEFFGTRLESDGSWEHSSKNISMVKQTGKAMPIEFNEHVSRHIMGHIERKPINVSGQRFLKPNDKITEAKLEFCTISGYANQEKACDTCWIKETCHVKNG
mgnify:CR=1 FL=1